MTTNFHRTAEWLHACGKERGNAQHLSVQMGCDAEEIAEWFDCVRVSDDDWDEVRRRIVRDLDSLGNAMKIGKITGHIPVHLRVKALDALCDRFEVDRSNRTFHGALIDCELLGEVYLAMTRGQESLLMDIEPLSSERGGPSMSLADGPRPRVQAASAEELAAHEGYLDELDKAMKGPCLWRQTPPEAA